MNEYRGISVGDKIRIRGDLGIQFPYRHWAGTGPYRVDHITDGAALFGIYVRAYKSDKTATQLIRVYFDEIMPSIDGIQYLKKRHNL